MLKPVRTTAPAVVVDLAAAKLHCRVDHADEDTLITALVAAATEHLDGHAGILGLALVTQKWRQDFGCFRDCLRLPLGPVQSIDSVKYYDAADVLQTVDPAVYALYADPLGPVVMLRSGKSWPGPIAWRPDAVQVTAVCGFGAAGDVPAPLRAAILLLVGHLYANREATIAAALAKLPIGVDALIAPYRRVGF